MDPRTNPYAPGAGTIPPELVGRDDIIEEVDVQLDRCHAGLAHRGVVLKGLRGVGKTVLLTRLFKEAEAKGFGLVSVEAPEGRSLPAALIPQVRSALLKLKGMRGAVEEKVNRAIRMLGGFASAMKVSYQDIQFQLDLGYEPGADTGDLESDLSALFLEIGGVAKAQKTAFVLFIDEVQYVKQDQFAALIRALHQSAQRQLPVSLVAAGLPQVTGLAGKAKSYAERLFQYIDVGALDESETRRALESPASKHGVRYEDTALRSVFDKTQGYPYFIQEWGRFCWQCADVSPITLGNVEKASDLALAKLDAGFFNVRFERLTPSEKRYLRAMAEVDGELKRSGDIAAILGRSVQTVAPVRASLIKKGMAYSPSHGNTCFTVPLFGGYMRRVMPEASWKEV